MKKNQLLKIWFISVFLLLTGFVQASENYGEEKSCKNLGKVTDIDNLLFQMYSNIDSQCLFRMSTKELEGIWDIPLIDYTESTYERNKALDEKRLEIFEKEDTIFIVKEKIRDILVFSISVTAKYRAKFTKEYNNSWALDTGKFPKLLPVPNIINLTPYDGLDHAHMHGASPIEPKNTVYQENSRYYWLNKKSSGQEPALYIYTVPSFRNVAGIRFYNKAYFLEILDKGVDYGVK